MRLRGLVFERYVTFERAEVSLCDEGGKPLDVVVFVGENGSGKTALLRGIAGLLSEAVGGGEELDARDVRHGETSARCRIVFDDVVDGERLVVTLEKEVGPPSSVRAVRPEVFERWQRAVAGDRAPRAAFSIASTVGAHHEEEAGEDASSSGSSEEGDPLLAWLFGVRGTKTWDAAVVALERVLWPYRLDHMTAAGELVFSGPAGQVSASELGDAFESVMVMGLELLRLSTERPNDDLAYVIDDIEAHLHPRWQTRILGDLRRAFPRVQLIATTQSPFVVASVDPQHVFRIELGKTSATAASLSRVADRIPKNGQGFSAVMEHAFGAPDLPGPRWVHVPSTEIRREVLDLVEPELERGGVVSVLPELVYSREIRDAFGEPAIPNVPGASGHVFFIDHAPGSAWGHPCEYVFRANDGSVTRYRAIWPPGNVDRFIPIGRG